MNNCGSKRKRGRVRDDQFMGTDCALNDSTLYKTYECGQISFYTVRKYVQVEHLQTTFVMPKGL